MSDPVSQPLLSELEGPFSDYLQSVCHRTARALETTGFSSLLVHSGSLLTIFEDDRPYPFEVNPPFKVWVPLSDVSDCFVFFAAGQSPQLLFQRPPDYEHKPAAVPKAYWTGHFDIRLIEDRPAARRLLPRDLSRTAYIGDAFTELTSWEVGAVNPARLMHRLDFERAVKLPYELQCLREANRLGA